MIRKNKFARDLDVIKAVTAERTESYTPITHKQVIELINDTAKANNVQILSADYYATQDCKIAEGHYKLGYRDSEMELNLVWQNSTNKQVSFKSALGAKVMVCENGCVWGDQGYFKRVHTGDADVYAEEQVKQLIKSAESTFIKYQDLRTNMRSIVAPKIEYKELAGVMFFDGLITSDQINIIKDQFEKPSFDYGKESEGTVWEFYQHITHSFKVVSPRNYLPKQIKVGEFLSNKYELSF